MPHCGIITFFSGPNPVTDKNNLFPDTLNPLMLFPPPLLILFQDIFASASLLLFNVIIISLSLFIAGPCNVNSGNLWSSRVHIISLGLISTTSSV